MALPQLQPRHLVATIVLGVIILVLVGIVLREMYYAANPDKRPRKRRRRR